MYITSKNPSRISGNITIKKVNNKEVSEVDSKTESLLRKLMEAFRLVNYNDSYSFKNITLDELNKIRQVMNSCRIVVEVKIGGEV